jgi:hypothetical protein
MTRTFRLLAACALASVIPAFGVAHERASAPPSTVHADDDEATPAEAAARKRKKVTDLLEAMHQKEIGEVALEQTLGTFAEMGMPETFSECFKENFDLDHTLEFTGEVYAEQLDEATVDALLVFYRSEGGKAYVEKMPEITLETMKRGTEYGKQVGTDCARGK